MKFQEAEGLVEIKDAGRRQEKSKSKQKVFGLCKRNITEPCYAILDYEQGMIRDSMSLTYSEEPIFLILIV